MNRNAIHRESFMADHIEALSLGWVPLPLDATCITLFFLVGVEVDNVDFHSPLDMAYRVRQRWPTAFANYGVPRPPRSPNMAYRVRPKMAQPLCIVVFGGTSTPYLANAVVACHSSQSISMPTVGEKATSDSGWEAR
jgi:hypothetical protein